MAAAVIFVPALLAVLALVMPSRAPGGRDPAFASLSNSTRWVGFASLSNHQRPLLMPLAALIHLPLTLLALGDRSPIDTHAWLGLDPPGRLVLLLVSVLFLFVSFYGVGYLRHRIERDNRVFVACVLGLLSGMSLVTASRHLGLGWVAVEATTLCGAPLIYFNRNQRSLEATWKYLIIGSIGIALALLGSFFFGYAALSGGQAPSLYFDELLHIAPEMSGPWLDAAFVLMLVGYGTKMGLAPMHTWKPDAYGEAPGLAGALFAGGVTSCAFLTLLRMFHLCDAAGEAAFPRVALIALGVASMAVAAVFVLRQRDIKRMLAYSSVEHMGILAIALGLGGAAVFGALLHLVNNALAKGVMFLSAGNIHRAYGSKSTTEVRGVIERLPISGTLFFAGFLAVTGSPPFGPFVSELTIINAGVAGGSTALMMVFLVLLLVVFFGMGSTVLSLVQGPSTEPGPGVRPYRDHALTAGPLIGLMAFVVMLGLWIPPPLKGLIDEAVAYLHAGSP